MKEIGCLKTQEGVSIQVTQEVLEDLYVLSSIYSVSIEELVRDMFDAEIQTGS